MIVKIPYDYYGGLYVHNAILFWYEMSKLILGKDTVVHGKLSSNEIDVNDRLIVNGDDIIVKVPIQGEIKSFTMSKIVEAIIALNERTCMMYPDHEFIKAADAIPSHDTNCDMLPDLLSRRLTIEITGNDGTVCSFSVPESKLSTDLIRGNMLTSGEIDILIERFKTSEVTLSNPIFISPIIYEDAKNTKVILRYFPLEDRTNILPTTDGLYTYTVNEKPVTSIDYRRLKSI